MKILALGGCGGMGKVAVTTAARFAEIDEIVVADRDFDAARRFADDFTHKVTPAKVDAFDSDALDHLMVSCDLVVSTLGPYYLFGARVLESAIRCNTHYIDICDDWEPTLDMLAFHEKAEAAGITAIIGAGASPGISNMLAKKAIQQLAVAEEVYTLWGSAGPIDSSEQSDLGEPGEPLSAATIHWIQQVSGSVKVIEQGALVDTAPLREVCIDYPGIGEDVCHICGHPEPITLARYYPSIQRSYNLMNMPSYVIYALKSATKDIREGSFEEIKKAAEKLRAKLSNSNDNAIDVAKFLYYLAKDKPRSFFPELAAVAIGKDDAGKDIAVSAHLEAKMKQSDMAHHTCIPTAVMLKMFLHGNIVKRGVFAPEGCVDPDIFFGHLLPYMNIRSGFDQSTYLNISRKPHSKHPMSS